MKVSEIMSIECCGTQETIDIETDGNNLFYANGILTHNSGQNSSDVTMSDIAGSIGVANTADLIICGISNNEMEEEGVMLLKLEKNRLSRKDTNKFVSVKIDRPRMRYYDRDNSVPINTNQDNVSSINKKQKTKSNSNNDWSF